jgi:tetratricopeptide (TPR) repeat protein
LKQAFQILFSYGKKEKELLKSAVEIFGDHSSEASIFLAEIFLSWGELEIAEKLLVNPVLELAQQIRWMLLRSHLSWRKGDFTESCMISTRLIENHPLSSQQLWGYFHRGMAHYFLGDSESALADFSHFHDQTTHPRYRGWAKCMLGTVFGMGGIDIPRGKNLLEEGIKMLTQEQDQEGLWVGWNNLGELLCRCGEYPSSASHLQQALHLSELLEIPGYRLETLRNLLQLKIRTAPPHTPEFTKLLKDTEKLVGDSSELTELVQLFPTLAHAYLIRGDLQKAFFYLKKAIPLTRKSQECRMYTLAVLALANKRLNRNQNASAYSERAKVLALKSNNVLAVRQLELLFQRG